MATEMDSYITFRKCNKEVFDRVREIFMDPDTESKHRDSNQNTPHMVNTLYGTNIRYKVEGDDNWSNEKDWVPQDWYDDNVGARWIHSDIDYLDDETGDGAIILNTANNVPYGFLNNLSKNLAKIKEDCYIYGTYECETYDPLGAFIFAEDYEDMEYNDMIGVRNIVEQIHDGTDIEDENYNGDTITYEDGYEWFNDSPNGREKLSSYQSELRDSLERSYFEYLQDEIDNSQDK